MTGFPGVGLELPHGADRISEESPFVSRACDACRKMKIRCIDKENPPCRRCRSQRLACTFDAGRRQSTSLAETVPSESPIASTDRLRHMEQHLNAMTQQVESRVNGLDQKLTQLFDLLVENRSLNPATVRRTQTTAGSTSLLDNPNTVNIERTDRPPNPFGWPETDSQEPINCTGSSVGGANNSSLPAISEQNSQLEQDEDLDDPLIAMAELNPYRSVSKHYRDTEHLETSSDSVAAAATPLRTSKRRRTNDSPSAVGRLASVGTPMHLGYCTPQVAKDLFSAFFLHAHPFIPVFDVIRDTYESISARSALCTSVILYVAANVQKVIGKSQDNGQLSEQCRKLAEHMVKDSLVARSTSLEDLQGLVVFASWSDAPWLLGCHAAAIAVDMRLYKSLDLLGSARPEDWRAGDPSRDVAELMNGARVWLAVTKLVYETSFNNGLPLPFASTFQHEDSVAARELLKHPASNLYDSRFIVSVEMLQARAPIYVSSKSSDPVALEDLDSRLLKVNDRIRDRKLYWDHYYKAVGLPSDHFLVKELHSQEAYAIMYANSCAWIGVHAKKDVTRLSQQRKQLLIAAMRAAAFLVQSIGSGAQNENSEYGNRYFHFGIVSTARYLIRMCALLPEVCDRNQVSMDIDALLLKLPHYSVSTLAADLRAALASARQRGTLPMPMSNFTNFSPQTVLQYGSLSDTSPKTSTPGDRPLDMQLLNQLFPTAVTDTLLDNVSHENGFNWDTADWNNFESTMPWLENLQFGQISSGAEGPNPTMFSSTPQTNSGHPFGQDP